MMKWTADAEAAVAKVPFFVRRRVKKRVEEHVSAAGRSQVTLDDVYAVKKSYMGNMEKEVAGYRIETCFGSGGCPNRAAPHGDLAGRLETLLGGKDLLGFLKETVNGPLKFHHEFGVTLADCPNACSRPQIKDIGIIGVSIPEVSETKCSGRGSCVEACSEEAVSLDESLQMPGIDRFKCLDCGRCAAVCPTGTIKISKQGYKILLGGKLGRHPRLAEPLPGIYEPDAVLDIVSRCVDFYKKNAGNGKRFAQLYAENPDAVKAALAGLIDHH
jgi:dissimilatory sulfite reductase (desulfoviridin) alpha/beta subunit